jgi:hypothetical protein
VRAMPALIYTGQFQRSRIPRKRGVPGYNGKPIPPRPATADHCVTSEDSVAGMLRSRRSSWTGMSAVLGSAESPQDASSQEDELRSPVGTYVSGALGGRWSSMGTKTQISTAAAEGVLSSWSNEIRETVGSQAL